MPRRPDISKIVTLTDAARIYGLDRANLHRSARNPRSGFPRPLGQIGNYPVYYQPDIEKWVSGRAA